MTDFVINTNIEFIKDSEEFTKTDVLTLNLLYEEAELKSQVPEAFSWSIIEPQDDISMVAKKKLISKPENQQLCGSCWAVATSGVVGDAFVVSGLVNWQPNISSTYALINYPQNQCKGGDPAALLKRIASSGIASKHCIDYSWCAKNNSCSTSSSSNHFGVDLSSLIPKQDGCFFDSKHYFYYIDKPIKTIAAGINDDINVSNIQELIKKQIIESGPVIAGFIVFNNFTSGKFSQINSGVYFEKGNYNGNRISFSAINTDSSRVSGGHAVAVIGWGIAKNVKIGNESTDIADVPYWYCRNSWGETWGENGYFKMAMYPYNKKSQFTKIVEVADSRGLTRRLGGVLCFQVSSAPELKSYKVNKNTSLTNTLLSREYYMANESDIVTKIENIVPIPGEKREESNIAIFVVLIIFITLLFYFMKL